jgi:gliding motility-associated-like protein
MTLVVPNAITFSENDGFFVPDPNETGTLTGHLYLDANGNGTQDAGELDLADVDVLITDSQNNTQIVATNANGDWTAIVPTGNTESDIDETDTDFPTGATQTEGTDPTMTLVVPNTTSFSENDGFFVPDSNDTGTLTGHLYLDANGNGTQDLGEMDLADVDVLITDSQNNTQTVTTDANGDWTVIVPTGNTISDIDETDTDFPTGATQTEGTDPTMTLVVPNATSFSENDGFFVPDSNDTGTLTGHLYLDANGNGTQDAGEMDLADVDVLITDSQNNVQAVTTNANGDWSVIVPTGNTESDIDETDTDFPTGATQTEGTDPTMTLVVPNATSFSENDGFFVPDSNDTGSLTGHLYLDVNGNGTQDAGELDLADVDVLITDSQNNTQTVTTDANGDWTVIVPTGNTESDIDETDTDFPVGAIQTEGTDPTMTLVVPNATSFSENDGFFVPDPNDTGTLTGHLYLDADGNGTQDAGELDLADVDVLITDSQNNVQTVTTDANGDWFVVVPTGNTESDIDETDTDFPTGAIQTEGTDPTMTLVVPNATSFSENDGFFVPDPNETGTLTGHLYLDANGNGTQDAGELDLADVDVLITDSQNNVQTVTTDANGDWSVIVPTGNTESDIDETDTDFPTGAIQTEGTDPTMTLVVPNAITFSENDGFFVPDPNETGTLTGHLYLDVNGNGTQDAGELDLADVDVLITDSQNNTQTVTTDANGDWSVIVPTGNTESDIDETDTDFPTGATQTEGTDPTMTLVVPNAITFSENDGFFVPDPNDTGTLTGHLYLDANGNGTQDAGELDLADVDVLITDSQNNIQTVTTDANGDWTVIVPTGNTESDIDETDTDFPTGATQTEGTDPTMTLVVPNATSFSENDGFFVPDLNETGTLTGYLYLDANGNGTQDAGELDLADVDVLITDSQNNVQTVTTDANGDWSVVVSTGNTESDIDETDADFPTGATQTEGTDPTMTLVVPNAITFSENDGFFVPDPNDTGTLTGHLYLDANGNGTQDAGELDLADVDVLITDSQNNIQTVTTDANGDWSVVVPTGNTESDIDETDADFPTGAIQTEGTDPTTTTVIPNATSFSENDGFFVPDPNDTGTLTGHLYLDANGNGTQDAGELDLADVDVLITDSQNNTQTVTTNANGDWSVIVPTGNTESDIDETDTDFPTGATQTEGTDPTMTLVVPNTTSFSENDGFFVEEENQFATLTGRIYLDENGNGIQDPTEQGIADISIEIEEDSGFIQTVVSDSNGDWTSDVLAGGVISTIDESDPDFPTNATQTEGTNPTVTTLNPNETFHEVDGFFAEREVIVYNAVSPNGDGKNDFLRIEGLEQFETNSIEIFNRNGVRVYETRDYGSNDNLFRGFSDGRITIRKSEKLPSGTYFYILNYTDSDGRTTKRQGYLYIN